MTLIWAIAFLGLLLVEFLTVGLVSIWFALGALGGCVTSLITDKIWIQIVVAIVVTIVSLVLTKNNTFYAKSSEGS